MSRARVLIVDDEPLVGRGLARLLEREHEVTVVTSGAEAVRFVDEGPYDLVLCDLMMPHMTGMDVYAAVAAKAPAQAARIVFMTGGAFTAEATAFLESGRPHIEKPVSAEELRALVRERTR